MNKMPKIGDAVRLKTGGTKDTARVHHYIADVPGGVVLDRPLEGFHCWNKLDLVRVGRPRLTKEEG